MPCRSLPLTLNSYSASSWFSGAAATAGSAARVVEVRNRTNIREADSVAHSELTGRLTQLCFHSHQSAQSSAGSRPRALVLGIRSSAPQHAEHDRVNASGNREREFPGSSRAVAHVAGGDSGGSGWVSSRYSRIASDCESRKPSSRQTGARPGRLRARRAALCCSPLRNESTPPPLASPSDGSRSGPGRRRSNANRQKSWRQSQTSPSASLSTKSVGAGNILPTHSPKPLR